MNKNTFSNRVTWYNFILCIFVVWIHAQNTDLFTEVVMIEGKPLFNQIEQTIVSDIAVVGVAGFFLCSGYLFYRNYSWGKSAGKIQDAVCGTADSVCDLDTALLFHSCRGVLYHTFCGLCSMNHRSQ